MKQRSDDDHGLEALVAALAWLVSHSALHQLFKLVLGRLPLVWLAALDAGMLLQEMQRRV